jgi:N-methylhydantoinase B
MNSVISTTKSASYLAFKHVFPEIPVNSGCFAPIAFDVPESTFLNATLPRPVAGCAAEVAQRIADVVMGALGQAIPERVSAGIFGTVCNLTIGVISVARSQPVELFEQRYPVRIVKFALREGSGGAGQFRGGLGAEIETEFLRGEGTASTIGDRGRFAPKGLDGGAEGAKCHMEFLLGEQRYVSPHLTKDSNIRMAPGDRVRILTPGGGGYGDPLTREPALVAEDLRNGYISRETARRDYGVIFKKDSLDLDEAATRAERKKAGKAGHKKDGKGYQRSQ